jgi:long-chain acyl-CoA synthetase
MARPVIAIGKQRSYIVALLTLEPEAVKAFAETHDLADTSIAQLHAHPAIKAEIEADIAAANAKLVRVEQIKNYTILPNVPDPLKSRLISACWPPGGR